MAHHPEKFLDGRMLWRGRIYSPLPFVRSLWGTRINAGVWGTAAFPSVYRTDVHPFAFLPHSIRWQVHLVRADARRRSPSPRSGDHAWAAALLLGTGVVGIAVDDREERRLRAAIGGRLAAGQPALVSRGRRVPALPPAARAAARADPRRAVAARSGAAGRRSRRRAAGRGRRSREAWRALLLHLRQRHRGSLLERDVDVGRSRARRSSTDWLRRSRAVRTIEIDEGWSDDRDVSVLVGRWAWLDVRALVEEHGGGKALLRVSTHLRPTSFGVVTALGARRARCSSRAASGVALRWPLAGAIAGGLTVCVDRGFVAWRTAQTTAIVRRGVAAVTVGAGHDRDAVGPGARAAARAVAAAHATACAARSIFVVMILGARRRHVHAARGGDRRR